MKLYGRGKPRGKTAIENQKILHENPDNRASPAGKRDDIVFQNVPVNRVDDGDIRSVEKSAGTCQLELYPFAEAEFGPHQAGPYLLPGELNDKQNVLNTTRIEHETLKIC